MKTTKLILLLLTALLVGVCIGFFSNSAIIRTRIQQFSEIRANRTAHVIEKLTEHLELTEEQQGQIRSVVLTYEVRITEAQEKSQALFDSPLKEMAEAITPYLTPKQRDAYEKMWAKHNQRHQKSRALMSAFPSESPQ